MLAAHLGVIDEEQINNMSYVFFDDVLRELGYKLNYEAVVNYAGNAFCEKAWDMIDKSNPFNIADGRNGTQAMNNLVGFFGNTLEEGIAAIYAGTDDDPGLYALMRSAVELAVQHEDVRLEYQASLSSQQEIENRFALAMGDMLIDG